jgi:hypothetical protein
MICEACHAQQTFPPCPECGGFGIAHCCDGLIECSLTDGTARVGESPSQRASFDSRVGSTDGIPHRPLSACRTYNS